MILKGVWRVFLWCCNIHFLFAKTDHLKLINRKDVRFPGASGLEYIAKKKMKIGVRFPAYDGKGKRQYDMER